MHLKVPGWLSDYRSLLTKKLPMFLSSLNDTNGKTERNSLLVSGSVLRGLKFLRMVFLSATS